MSQEQRIGCAVTITVKDINGNNVAKVFNQVKAVNIDYFDGTINIQDVSGSFTFGFTVPTALTYVIAGTQHSITIT